jgi:hypothetical protein
MSKGIEVIWVEKLAAAVGGSSIGGGFGDLWKE